MFLRHKERGSHSHTLYANSPAGTHCDPDAPPDSPPPRTNTEKRATHKNQDHKHNPTCTPHAQTRKHRALPNHPTHIHRHTHTHTHTYQAAAGAGAAESPARQHGPRSWSGEPAPTGEGRGLRRGGAAALRLCGDSPRPAPRLRRSVRAPAGREETPLQ